MHCLLKMIKNVSSVKQVFFWAGGGGGGGCKKDIQIAIIKTKNVGENRKNRKSKAPRSELMDELN